MPVGEGEIDVLAAFSFDGSRVVSAGIDGTLKLWAATSGRLLQTFKHSDGVTSVTFSPDGRQVLSGGRDKTLKLWDAATGKLVRTFQGHSNDVTSVAFYPMVVGCCRGATIPRSYSGIE